MIHKEENSILLKWKKSLNLSKEKRNILKDIMKTVKKEDICPKYEDIFNIFKMVAPEDVKVVIIGQDPYPKDGDANGLAFAVNEHVPIPASMRNIFKEIQNDLKTDKLPDKTLIPWVKQGVLLLNSWLTTAKGKTHGHKHLKWEIFTDEVIKYLNDSQEHIVFILWGNFAKKKYKFITSNSHLVLQSPHPSPLSAYNGFWGNQHFSKTNIFLKKHGRKAIKWI